MHKKPDLIPTGEAQVEPAAESDQNPEDDGQAMATNVAEPPTEYETTGGTLQLTDRLEKELVQIFKLLSDETRLRILLYLGRERELHVTALCAKLGQSQPAVSHHLALLRVAGLIEPRRDGKHNFYSLRRTHFHHVLEELFQCIADPVKDEIRFDEFILMHHN